MAIHGRLLEIRDAERLLVEMDSTLAMEENSFLRLRAALVSKCGNSMEIVVRHMADIVTHLATSSADFSAEGLRGSPRTGNSGLLDTSLLKKEALGYLCHKLPVQLGIEGDAAWLSDLRVSLAPCIPERRWPCLAQPPHACPGSLRCVRAGPSIWHSPRRPNRG